MLGKSLQAAVAGQVAGGAYIEDVFSTYLYTGNGSTQTITNGIDLDGEGGMVWCKVRSNTYSHQVFDTERGATKRLSTNSIGAQATEADTLTSFNSDGFSLLDNASINNSGQTFASWSFRKAPKFFDVVTYTGDGVNGRTVSHNLGSTPGCIFVKMTSTISTYGWCVYHRSCTGTLNLRLNSTEAQGTTFNGEITNPTDTTFTVSSLADVNQSGQTFVAYLFAHDAGGFGDAGEENVISCGTCTANTKVTLGWEPQWILVKTHTSADNWRIYNNMTMNGMAGFGTNRTTLFPNTSGAETTDGAMEFDATGFTFESNAIYIAIRRGPMKTPTDGTSVFAPVALTPTSDQLVTTNFPVDMTVLAQRDRSSSGYTFVHSRLLGGSTADIVRLYTNTTDAQYSSSSGGFAFDNNIAVRDKWYNSIQGFNSSTIYWNFKRAPGFFDVVCYTGTGVARTVAHNLGVVPELMIVKRRDSSDDWIVYVNSSGNNKYLILNRTDADTTTWAGSASGMWNTTTPTSLVFSLGTSSSVNASGGTYIAYLFASVPGVSKVGSYTGNGNFSTGQTIDCGFSNGARFVLVKDADAAENWNLFDTARGIVSGNDPKLSPNSTGVEVTNTDYIDPDSSGFIAISDHTNTSGRTYIYLAIA